MRLPRFERKREPPPSVHEVCQRFFDEVEASYLDSTKTYILPIGGFEVIRLYGHDERFDALLGRPIGQPMTAEGIVYRLDRISLDIKNYQRHPHLVSLLDDGHQWYVQEKENDIPVPYGQDLSREVNKFMETCYLMPL